MNTFMLSMVTDTRIIYSGQAGYCKLRTLSGSIGFEAFHEPFLGILEDNSIVSYTDTTGRVFSQTLESGIISFRNNICTIIFCS